LTLTETNNTAYIISVQLTGPTVMTVLVDPHSQRVVHVAPGSYNVFASVPGNPQITPKSMEAKFQAGYKYDEPWFIVPKARA